MGQTITDVLLDRHVWKQGEGLKYVSGPALCCRYLEVFCGVKPTAVANVDSSGVWHRKARNAVEQGSLSCSRSAEQNGEAGSSRERNVQDEVVIFGSMTLVNLGVETQRLAFVGNVRRRRCSRIGGGRCSAGIHPHHCRERSSPLAKASLVLRLRHWARHPRLAVQTIHDREQQKAQN